MTAPVPTPAAAPSGHQQHYASPIPVRTTNLKHALASEWTKIRTVRSTVWTLGVMLALVIGVNLLVLWAVTASSSGGGEMPVLSPGLFGVMLGELAVITLGVLVITSEYGTGMIRTTFTACPQRARVLTAKAIVFFLLSFVITTVACTLTALLNWSVLSGESVDGSTYVADGVAVSGGMTTATVGQWVGATLGVGLYVALLGLLALAVGTILRHSAGAITAMMGVVLLPLLIAIFMAGTSLHKVRTALIEYSAPNALASLYRIPMLGDVGADGVKQLLLLGGITAIALAGAYAVLAKRDV